MDREVLLLNSCEKILRVISWKKAVKMLLTGKAIKPLTRYNETYVIKTPKGDMTIPAAIVLFRFYELPEVEVKPTRRNIFRRDDNTCQYCGVKTKNQKNLTIDHVRPKCLGGDNTWTNLVTSCRECNLKKGNMLLKEFGCELLRKPQKPKSYALHLMGLDENGKKLWSRWVNI